MPKFFKNIFFIPVLILAIILFPFHSAEAKGVFQVVTLVVAIVIGTIVNIACAGCLTPIILGFTITDVVLMGTVAIGATLCLFGTDNPYFKGCGSSSSSSQGTPGSPTLNSQTATPIKSNEGCTIGFTLSYDVTDAYQYGIYRDGNLISQATLSTTVQPSPFNSKFSYSDTNLAPVTNYTYVLNLVSKDGKQFSYPEMKLYTDCLPHIIFNGPSVVKYPDSFTLSWIAENVNSLTASGDWSGPKEMGTYPYKSESLSKPRGTYTFILSGIGPGGSDSKQVTTQVIKVPRCDFSADPTSIILPQSSTLSWSCSYADTCSIDQGIGSVNNVSGSKEVRPSATTTYTLTCDGLDGSRSWQSTVNVGFTPRLREVAP